MASVGKSLIKYARGTWVALLAGLAAITDPLALGKMTGLIDRDYEWLIGEEAMRAFFLLFAFIWTFFWFHGVEKKLERGVRDPNMPLYRVCRWIARDSVWASNYSWPDDQWIERVEAELFSKWQLGQFEMMGVDRAGNGSINFVPPVMKGNSQFEAHKLVTTDPPHHIWNEETRDKNGLPRCYYDVRLDRRDVMEVWPQRSLLSRILRKSPIERVGNYDPIFQEQDESYARGVKFPHSLLRDILGA